jgi:hypothetical protein
MVALQGLPAFNAVEQSLASAGFHPGQVLRNNPSEQVQPPESMNITLIPPAFKLPPQFQRSLPNEVQQWLASVEKRIDAMTLERIEEEANRLDDTLNEARGPDADPEPISDKLYRLGRRIFYTRMQQIVHIMFPDEGVEVGVDLLWAQTTNELPGAAVTNAVINGNGYNTDCLMTLKQAGFALGGSSLM